MDGRGRDAIKFRIKRCKRHVMLPHRAATRAPKREIWLSVVFRISKLGSLYQVCRPLKIVAVRHIQERKNTQLM